MGSSPVYSQAIADIKMVQEQKSVTIKSNESAAITAKCPGGYRATGGGGALPVSDIQAVSGKLALMVSAPLSDDEWLAIWGNHSQETVKIDIGVIMYCAKK